MAEQITAAERREQAKEERLWTGVWIDQWAMTLVRSRCDPTAKAIGLTLALDAHLHGTRSRVHGAFWDAANLDPNRDQDVDRMCRALSELQSANFVRLTRGTDGSMHVEMIVRQGAALLH